MSFLIQALNRKNVEPYLSLNEAGLVDKGARWVTATHFPGFPCRVSLQDASVGERVLLLPFTHLDTTSPYRASGPIFVREQACYAEMIPNQVPDFLRHRVISVRGYSSEDMMLDATTVNGNAIEQGIDSLFANPQVHYLHLHNAGPGCYMCKVNRC